MRHKSRKIVPEHAIEIEVVVCDLCNRDIEPAGYSNRVDEVQISHRTGYAFPGEGNGEIDRIDICGSCFRDRVRPLLERELGVRFASEDWDV